MTNNKVEVGTIEITLYEDGAIFFMNKNIGPSKFVQTLANAILLFERMKEDD